jgi:type I restriction enzyme S subunit
MNKIGWPMVALGELLKRVKRHELVEPSKTYDVLGAHWYAKGLYTKHSKPGSQIRAKYVYRVEQGDFVYNRLFAWKGSFAIATQENDGCHVSNEFPCFVIDRERLDGQYLWYYFSRASAWNEALGLSSGGTPTSRNRLKEARLLAMHIPLPPLAEQRRIVARIEELAAKVEAARALRLQAAEGTEALMISALRTVFCGRLAAASATTVDDVCEAIIDNLHSTPQYSDQGYPCVRSSDVEWGKLDLTNARRTPEHEYIRRTSRGTPGPGDLVFVREGGGTGKAALVETEKKFSLGQRVMMFRPNTGKVDPKFFLFQMLSPFVYEEQIAPRIKGSASPHVNIGALRQFRFLLPSLDRQRRIVAYLNALQAKVDAVKQHQAATATTLDALLPSILDRAFKGEL